MTTLPLHPLSVLGMLRGLRALSCIALLSAAGCSTTLEQYVCDSDPQCHRVMSDGICLAGSCAFPDPSCMEAYRFGEAAGSSSNQCVSTPDGGTNDIDARRSDDIYYQRPIPLATLGSMGALADFPVPVEIVADSHLASIQPSLAQLRFVLGGEVLDHEINHSDFANGSLFAWVKMPNFPATETLYLEYGQALVAGAAGSVWSSEYSGVYHFDNSDTSALIDSSPFHNDGSPRISADFPSPDPGNAGKFGTASSGCWGLGDVFDYTERSPFTISFWAQGAASTVDYPRLLSNVEYSTGDRVGYNFEHTPAGRVVFFRSTGATEIQLETPEPLPLDNFSYVVLSYDGTTQTLYADGVVVAAVADPNSLPMTPTNVEIACEENSRLFQGLLDEVRVASTARTSGWIASSYSLQANPVVVLGAVESVGE